ncbi:MAG: glycosyltransferase [Actinobacteria bacterium]|nr:glycosyltransferase [Actinomycetota bacterium]
MARILAYTSPSRGDLYPIVPVLTELRGRGHQVMVRTLSSAVPMLRELGFEAAPVAAEIEAIAHDDYRAHNPNAAIKRSLRVFARRAPFEQADLSAALEQEFPDAVLVDFNCWGAAAVAEQAGVAWGRWCSYPLPLPSSEAPPFGPGLPPAHGRLGRMRDRVLSPIVTGGFERIILPQVNEVRAAQGLDRLTGIADIVTAAPVLLSMTAEPFEYPRSDWPPSVRLIGPCTWEPPAPPPSWLAEVDRPLVLVTTSSEFQDDGVLVRVALEALADEPVQVVATVPAGTGTFAVPDNARVATDLPHAAILRHAACAVTHGGMGATQKALAHGVPVCVVPFGRDQHEVARRVQHAGAGVRLGKRALRGRNAARAFRDAVTATMVRTDGARAIANAFERAGNGSAGADAVEEVLLSSRPDGQAGRS